MFQCYIVHNTGQHKTAKTSIPLYTATLAGTAGGAGLVVADAVLEYHYLLHGPVGSYWLWSEIRQHYEETT